MSHASAVAAPTPGGYGHPAYAAALPHLGEPRTLPRSGAAVLLRPLPGAAGAAGARDARGPYPLFAPRDWTGLADDLAELGREAVSVVAVVDPFATPDEATLRALFPDLARPWKEHRVVDLAQDPASFVSPHHRRNARRAADEVAVEACARPAAHAAEWTELYAHLAARHAIRGPASFDAASLAAQLAVPGAVLLRAARVGRCVGMTLWYVAGEVAYYHLGAYAPEGYLCGASFALFADALARFRDADLRWLDLGAGAGVTAGLGAGEDGLTRFKRGWATGSRTAWLCGRVLDRRRYAALCAERARAQRDAAADGAYFPAYRAGESG